MCLHETRREQCSVAIAISMNHYLPGLATYTYRANTYKTHSLSGCQLSKLMQLTRFISRVIFVFCWHFLSNSNRLKAVRLFDLAGISAHAAKFWRFFGKMTPKKWKFRKTLAWRALPWLKPRLLSLLGLGYGPSGEKKYIHTDIHELKTQIGVIFHHCVGVPFLYRLRWHLTFL